MKRLIDYDLQQWRVDPRRKPLIIRGARQVGKTYAVRQLGKSFNYFIELNFESNAKFKHIFEEDLNPHRILRDLSLEIEKTIVPGETLLFFDEVQAVPNAILALRYFYEEIPELHVVVAGSLLDFAIQMVGAPVGRVTYLHMYPMTFIEFLCALGNEFLVEVLLTDKGAISQPIHIKLLELVGHYMALGGMPEVINCWKETKQPIECLKIHQEIILSYRQDFAKYAKDFQLKYVEKLFKSVPHQLGQRFKYSDVEGDFRKRDLAPCLDLLETAGLAHKVTRTSGNGIPLGAELTDEHFKAIFLDVGLAQGILKLQISDWFMKPLESLVNKGAIVESFVGQELIGYNPLYQKTELFYWQRDTRGSQTEIDYLVQDNEQVIPIEVKSGAGSTLYSMHLFLEKHPKSSYGIRLSTHNYSVYNNVYSYPLYAIVNSLKTFADIKERIL